MLLGGMYWAIRGKPSRDLSPLTVSACQSVSGAGVTQQLHRLSGSPPLSPVPVPSHGWHFHTSDKNRARPPWAERGGWIEGWRDERGWETGVVKGSEQGKAGNTQSGKRKENAQRYSQVKVRRRNGPGLETTIEKLELSPYQYWKMPLILPEMLVSVSVGTPICTLIRYHVIYLPLNGFFAATKRYIGSCNVLPLSFSIFKSGKELTELVKCLHLAIFYTRKFHQ